MLKFISQIFDTNVKELKKLTPWVGVINSLEPKYKKLKDEEFPAQTAALRHRLSEGEALDNLLPEAFALCREAIRRVVGERAFDVQLIAAAALHQGKVAEQKTGEGKTLSAAIAAYLNALTGKGVHIVTVNDYLARRDTGWYGKALLFSGLKVGSIIHEQSFLLDLGFEDKGQTDGRLRHLRPVERKEAYQADVTYGTNNEFGFDYLRDNMRTSFDQLAQRDFNFAIVDEVDSILIDEARTPLIISAPDTEPTQKYYQASQLISSLSSDTDYTIDEKFKSATLTEHGIKKVEKRLGIDNLYEKDFETIHHIENALRAKTMYLRDRDYVVKEGQVIIVDEFTGRLMFGRRWSDGLHQAVEAKEGVKIEQESKTLATVSFQNYFRMYKKLAGMTGTAATEGDEFEKIYGLQVVVVPTNLPMVRKDNSDVVYKTSRAKLAAIVSEIEQKHHEGQPILVGTTSIEKNEILHKFLTKKGIPHQVLNAKNHEKEALIIADAGKVGVVTVATNMAGRGVDIVLGGAKPEEPPEIPKSKFQMTNEYKGWEKLHEKVVQLGGLHVIGTERHESRRIDNQLRGRSGRQGDPGSSRFYVALDDDIMRIFGGDKIAHLMTIFKLPEDQPLEHPMVSKSIEQAQVKVESFNFDMRKRVVEYDDVMNKQREIIYGKRKKILEMEGKSDDLSLREALLKKASSEVADLVAMYAPEGFVKTEIDSILAGLGEILPIEDSSREKLKKIISESNQAEKAEEILTKILESAYESREKEFGGKNFREIERLLMMEAIDRLWIDHLDAMDDLREGIGLRGYGQLEPLVEYKKEAFGAFETLLNSVETEVLRRIFRVRMVTSARASMFRGAVEGRGQMPIEPPPVVVDESAAGSGKFSSGVDSRASRFQGPESLQGMTIRPVISGQKKIGRNDPCWCGSGKKWKRCHYPNLG